MASARARAQPFTQKIGPEKFLKKVLDSAK
jgi:hypothetical protein